MILLVLLVVVEEEEEEKGANDLDSSIEYYSGRVV